MKNTLTTITLIVTTILVTFGNSNAQKIRTIAGNGINGETGDGGAAVLASIGSAQGIIADAAGNIYISDADVNIVRKITTNGIITTIAGIGYPAFSGDGAAATNAALNYPSGLAIDKYGNLYIADQGNSSIRKVDTSGIITTVVGDGSHFWGFAGDGGLATAARLNGCVGLVFDKIGNMYIADNNSRIRKVNTAGIISTYAGSGPVGYTGDGGNATAAMLAGPGGIAIDTDGNIFFTDKVNNVIREVSASGIISTVAGNHTSGYSGDGGAAISASLHTPAGIAIDAAGNICFADQGNNRVRKINTSGIITTISGTGTAGYSGDRGLACNATMRSPSSLCIDAIGNLLNCLSALGEWFFRGYYVVERHWSCYHCLLNHPIE